MNLEEAAVGDKAGGESEAEPAAEESKWVVVDSSTVEGAGRAVELEVALQAFVATVEADGALGDGQLAMQLGDLGGQKGWRLELIRLTAGDLAPAVSAAYVVSEARARRGRMFRMMALAVDGEMMGQGMTTGAMRRLKEELLLVAGPRLGLVADLASCMKSGGAGFYAGRGWTGGGGSWSWRSEVLEVEEAGVVLDQSPAPVGGSGEAQVGGKAGGAEPKEGAADGAAEEEAEAAGLEAPAEALGQMLQVCDQDVSATDVALSELRGEGVLAGKRKRED